MKSLAFLAGAAHGLVNDGPAKYKILEESGHAANVTAEMDKKLAKMGLSVEKMKKTTHETLANDFHSDLAKVTKEAEEKSKTLSSKKSLEMLKGHLDEGQGQLIESLLEQGSSKVEPAMYVKAMLSLNDMQLRIDSERFNVLADCTQTLSAMFRQSMFFWDSTYFLLMDMGWTGYRMYLSEKEKDEVTRKLNKKEEEIEAVRQQQAQKMGALEAERKEFEADANLYRFILNVVNDQCAGKSGGSMLLEGDFEKASNGESLVQAWAKMSTEERATVEKTCAAKEKDSQNQLLLKVFSDPEVKKQIDSFDNDLVSERFRDQLGNLQESVGEQVDQKYSRSLSFLQKEQQPGGGYRWDQPWKPGQFFINDKGAWCGNSDVEGCDSLGTLVGLELECRKEILRAKVAEIDALKEKHKKINEELQKNKEGLISEISMHQNNYDNSKNEQDKYFQMYLDEHRNWREYHEDTMTERFKCYLKIQEIEQNSICAIKAIRGFMKKATDKALDIQEGVDYNDCVYGQRAYPQRCMIYNGIGSSKPQPDGREFKCRPKGTNKVGHQNWKRWKWYKWGKPSAKMEKNHEGCRI